MPERVYVGLDIGSSGIRAVAVTLQGRQVGEARRARTIAPMSLIGVERDLDLALLWRTCLDVLREVSAGRMVAAIGVAACRHGLVVLNGRDDVLFASGNDDVRASLAGASVESESDRSLLAVTGHTPAMIHWPGKLRWLTEERPDVCDAAARITTLEGWVAWQLGAEPVLTKVSAVETGAWDLAADGWASELIPSWAQSVLPAVEHMPALTRIRAQPELHPDCLVAAGWPDSHAADFATASAVSDGDCVAAGWSTTILRPVATHNPNAHVWRGERVHGGLVAEANAGDGGTGYGWLRGQNPSDELTMQAVATESAAESGVFAFCGLRVVDWGAPGLSVAGMLSPAPFAIGVPTAGMLGTAVLEDLAFAIHGNRLVLDAVWPSGGPIRLTGGYACAPAAGQILANVTGVDVCSFPELAAPAHGAAMAAAARDFGGLDSAARTLRPEGSWFAPDVTNAPAFTDHFERWRDLRTRLETFVQDTL